MLIEYFHKFGTLTQIEYERSYPTCRQGVD